MHTLMPLHNLQGHGDTVTYWYVTSHSRLRLGILARHQGGVPRMTAVGYVKPQKRESRVKQFFFVLRSLGNVTETVAFERVCASSLHEALARVKFNLEIVQVVSLLCTRFGLDYQIFRHTGGAVLLLARFETLARPSRMVVGPQSSESMKSSNYSNIPLARGIGAISQLGTAVFHLTPNQLDLSKISSRPSPRVFLLIPGNHPLSPFVCDLFGFSGSPGS
jgi:hypothetical protein